MHTCVTQTVLMFYMLIPQLAALFRGEGELGSFRNWDLAQESGVVKIGLESLSLALFS